MYQLVIFDLDGTLVDTVESMAAAGNRALEECGYMKRNVEEYKYFAGDGYFELVKRALYAAGDIEYTNYEKAVSLYQKYFKETCTYHITAYEGITTMLYNIKKKGLKVAVLTNKPHDRAISVLDSIFGKEFFELIVGQQEGLRRKPNPEGAFLITKQLKVDPSECIYVGDTNVDMRTGKAAGMFTIGVLWGFRDRMELESYNPNAIICKPEEILGHIC